VARVIIEEEERGDLPLQVPPNTPLSQPPPILPPVPLTDGELLSTLFHTPVWTTPGGDVVGLVPALTVQGLLGRPLSTAIPANGQALVWSAGAGKWVPQTVAGAGGTLASSYEAAASEADNTLVFDPSLGYLTIERDDPSSAVPPTSDEPWAGLALTNTTPSSSGGLIANPSPSLQFLSTVSVDGSSSFTSRVAFLTTSTSPWPAMGSSVGQLFIGYSTSVPNWTWPFVFDALGNFTSETGAVTAPTLAATVVVQTPELDAATAGTDGGNQHAFPAGTGALMAVDSADSVTGVKTFSTGTVKLNNAGGSAAATLIAGVTAARSWTFPDFTDAVVGVSAAQSLAAKTISDKLTFADSSSAVSGAGTGAIRWNSGAGHLQLSENGGGWTDITGATTIPEAYLNGGAGPQTIVLDNTRKGIIVDGAGYGVTTEALDALRGENSSLVDPRTGAIIGVGVDSLGELDGYAVDSVSKIIRLSGGSDDGMGDTGIWDNGIMVMPPPTPAADYLPPGNLLLKAADELNLGHAEGGAVTAMAGFSVNGPQGVYFQAGYPQAGLLGGSGLVQVDTTLACIEVDATDIFLYGAGGTVVLNSGTGDIQAYIGASPHTTLGAVDWVIGGNTQLSWGPRQFVWTFESAFDVPGFSINSVTEFTTGLYPMFQIATASKPRLQVYGDNSQPVVCTGIIGPLTGAQITARATNETSAYHGAALALDNQVSGGPIWRVLNLHEDVGIGVADGLYIDSGFCAIAINPSNGTLIPFFTNTADIGTSSLPFTNSYWLGRVKQYNGVTTGGMGVPFIPSAGFAQDVAWSGALTTVLTYTPAGGVYSLMLVASATTAEIASLTVQVTYTDAVNGTTQTLTPFNLASVAANGTISAFLALRASNAANVVVQISAASNTSTKVSAVLKVEG
jgi:hypothetical protein